MTEVKNKPIHPLITEFLKKRGITSEDELTRFFNSATISSPSEMTNIDKICERIKLAITNKEKIVICGDYDADGTVSTAMLVRFFKDIGYPVSWYIPHRVEEGYGISAIGVEKLVQDGAQLLISVDNGIAAFDAGLKSIELAVDLIITDHHDLVGDKMPECFAILNPKIDDPKKTYRYLAGAGVVLYLLRALKRSMNLTINLDKHLLLCMIASVADVVPLRDENRTLVKKGLEIIHKHTQIPGLGYLFEEAGLNARYLNNLTAKDIGYKVAPMLNAAGRLEGAEKTILLLLTDDQDEAKEYAHDLKVLNLRRRAESDLLYERIKASEKMDDDVLVFSGDYHPGIIGVVAGKLKQELRKPVVIIAINEEGIGKASCRSIEGFNIKDAIESLKELHLGGGGHYMAAGFSIKQENIEQFRKAMNDHFKAKFDPSLFKPEIDLTLSKKDMVQTFLNQLEALEPFGAKLETPVVEYAGEVTSISVIKEKHLLITLDNILTCWLFFKADQLESIQGKLYLKVVGELTIKSKKPSLIITRIEN